MGDKLEWRLDLAPYVTEIARARELADRIAADLRLSERAGMELRMALHEAVANAVIHGCRRPHDRVSVHAHADMEDAELTVDVVDPGGRFVRRPRPSEPLAASGRGSVLLEATTDHWTVEVEPGRTTLRFHKRFTPHDAGDTTGAEGVRPLSGT